MLQHCKSKLATLLLSSLRLSTELFTPPMPLSLCALTGYPRLG